MNDSPTEQPLEALSSLRDDICALAERAFPRGRALFTENFMYVSRDQYPLPWLGREIDQNFVDKNPHHPGTLNGVEITETELPEGVKKFTITGNWAFTDYSGLVNLHSDKTDESLPKAGGNGIGLKQTVLRLMRDFGVSVFEVQGEGWKVPYCMVSADQINSALDSLQDPRRVSCGVLMALPQPLRNTGVCRYIIETARPEVISEIQNLRNLAVCDQNAHLENADFSNNKGIIKWLPVVETTAASKKAGKTTERKFRPANGKIFINGQISRYRESNAQFQSTPDDFWGGPCGVTLALHEVGYPMTLDRAPLSNYEIENLSSDFMESLTKAELIQNLHVSEHLWPFFEVQKYDWNNPFSLNLLTMIIGRLIMIGFSREEYEAKFGDKKYLCLDKEITEEQKARLTQEGYSLCPPCFQRMHMPKVSARLSELDVAISNKADFHLARKHSLKTSIEAGLVVPYATINERNPETMGLYLKKGLGEHLGRVCINKDRVRTITIGINKEINPDELTDTDHKFSSTTPVALARTLAYEGISSGIFSDIFLAQGQYVSTFSLHFGTLVIRNNPYSSDETYLSISFKNDGDMKCFFAGLTDPSVEEAANETKRIREKETIENQVRTAVAQRETMLKEFMAEKDRLLEESQRILREAEENARRIVKQAKHEAKQEIKAGKKDPEERRSSIIKATSLAGVLIATATAVGVLLHNNSSGGSGEENILPIIAGIASLVVLAVTGVYLLKKDKKNNSDPNRNRQSAIQQRINEENKRISEQIDEQMRSRKTNTTRKAGTTVTSLPEILREFTSSNVGHSSLVIGKDPATETEEFAVEDFRIIEPTSEQLEQFTTLIEHLALTTGYNAPNGLFVYTGKGALGLNRGSAIGLHANVFSTSFEEASALVLRHEVTHNMVRRHNSNFALMYGTLCAKVEQSIDTIARKPESQRTEQDKLILSAKLRWDEIRSRTK
ncbi:MAG: ATP synthase F0 subunit B [Candidatus Gracilibacteria bacterium]